MEMIVVAYAGLDTLTLALLTGENDLELRYVNKIDEFAKCRSSSPVDYLFVHCYRAIERGQWNKATILYQWFSVLQLLASRLYRRYANYLKLLLQSRPTIVDFENTANTAALLSQGVDILVVNNWWLLPKEIVYAPRHKALNIHPSRLPQYRGSLPTLWSLKHRDKASAVSFMVLDSSMDTGGVLDQVPFSIEKGATALDVECEVERIVEKHFLPILRRYVQGSLLPQGQQNSLASTTARYYPYMKIDCHSEAASDIFNKVLLYPYLWPLDCCYIELRGRRIPIRSLRIRPSIPELLRGYVTQRGLVLYLQADAAMKVRLFIDIDFLSSVWLIAQLRGSSAMLQ